MVEIKRKGIFGSDHAIIFSFSCPILHQVWFSDPDSLRLRYSLAAKLGLRGVAAWNLEHLYFQSEAGITSSGASKRELQMRTEMWRAVEAFFEEGGSDNAECAGSTTVI